MVDWARPRNQGPALRRAWVGRGPLRKSARPQIPIQIRAAPRSILEAQSSDRSLLQFDRWSILRNGRRSSTSVGASNWRLFPTKQCGTASPFRQRHSAPWSGHLPDARLSSANEGGSGASTILAHRGAGWRSCSCCMHRWTLGTQRTAGG